MRWRSRIDRSGGLREDSVMRRGSLPSVIAALLALATSSGASAANPGSPKVLTFGTGSPGGVYYLYGKELAKILTEKLAITVNALPTQGTIHNVKLIESGGAELGMTTTGVALQGWNGTGDWTGGKKFQNMRALFPMYDTPFQAAALKRSGITSLAQFDNKRIGIGPRAGTGGTYIPAILKLLGISAQLEFGALSEMADGLLTGNYEAVAATVGAPFSALEAAEAKEPVTFIVLSAEQIEAIRKAMPEFSPSKIAAGTYRSLEKDYDTIGMFNFAIGRAELADDLVYQLVKAVFENQPRLAKASPTASETIPQNVVKDTFLPFHPGAVRYYREIGISIPDALAATN
jgi:uncharacterized protein